MRRTSSPRSRTGIPVGRGPRPRGRPGSATPKASTDRNGERTSESTTSMSWIIRSNTTPTSIERNVKPDARTASMNFGFRAWGRCRREGRIESLDVSDLEHELLSPGQLDQFIGLGHGRADGLLDEQMRPCFQKIDGQAVVQHGRRGDHGRIDAAQQAQVRGERARVQFGGQPIAVGGQRIDHSHEFHVGHVGPVFAHGSRPSGRHR